MASLFSDFHSHLQTTSYNRLALALFIFLLAMGYAVGFSIASQDAKNKKTEAFNTNLAVFTDWQMRISGTITRAATAAISLASFAQGQISTPMNYSASASSRLQILNPTAFELIATDLYTANPGIFSVELHSGGVISQMYPPDNSSLLQDLYAYASTKQQYATMWNGGNTLIAGPSNLLKISGYGLYVRQPIFISANKSKDTFWGTGNVVFKVSGPGGFLRLMNISELRNRHRMEHALWTYTTAGKLLTLDRSAEANMGLLINSAMRMTLPVGEPGKACFFALFPTDGEVTDDISSDKIALIVLVVLAGALVVIAAYYGALISLFCRRHRLAPIPVNGAPTYMALLTLRGAQAVVEHSPEEAQRVFASFIETVRKASARHGCYAVMPIGDRCLYVVGSDLKATLSMASECVSGINIVALANADEAKEEAQRAVADLGSRHTSTANNTTSKKPKPTVALKAAAEGGTPRESNYAHDRSDANSTCATQVVVGGESHITCQCSAVVRAAATTTRHYDSKSDVYFYGTSRDLGRAGSLLDQLKPRELGWTEGVDALCTADGLEPFLAELSSSQESSSRRVLDKGRLAMVCVQWGSNGDSEDDEEDASYNNVSKGGARGKKHNDSSDDASTAMVIMSDILLKKLTSQNDRVATLITTKSKAKNGTKNMKNSFLPSDQKRADGDLPKDGNSTVSTTYGILNDKTSNTTAKKGPGPQDSCSSDDEARNEAALLSRSCTVLAIRINGDPRAVFDTVKRVVEENRGRLVCCYENVMIAAYNLLSAGGHHQLRAADTVVRLRARLAGVVPFVAAIHHGKLSALVSASDGLVMPTGEVIQTCRVLLARANAMSCQLALALFERENTAGGAEIHHAVSGPSHGLCLLYCLAEMSSAYDCEAVDIEVRVVGAEQKVNSSIVEMATSVSTVTAGGDMSIVNDDLTHKAHLAALNSTSTSAVKTSSRVVYQLGLSKLMLSGGNNNAKSCGTGQGVTNASNSNMDDVLAVLMRANTTNYRTYGAAPASGGDDEWMYQLKDDQSAHSAVNLIFTRLQAGDVAEAELLYRRLCEDERLMAGLSVVAKKNLARLLKGS